MGCSRPLTEKQKKFCRNLIDGMTTKDAYLNAYDSKAKDTTAYSEATKLLRDDRIQQYIKTLSIPLEQSAQANSLSAREQQLAFINSRIQHCIDVDDEQSLIRYTDMLNKMHGLYKEADTTKSEQLPLDNLDTDKLIKLIG